jgi:5S rRNA maturation endonuclease (ribonuclease M5)
MPGKIFRNIQQRQRDVSKVNSNTALSAEWEKIASDKVFVISDNEGSGNCMFYALSEQLNLVKGIKISHEELRQSIVQYLRKNPKLVSLVFCFIVLG